MKLTSTLGAALVAIALTSAAQAAFINGTVTFGGNVSLIGGSPATATGATFLNPGVVLFGTGSFAANGFTTGSVVTFNPAPWTFTTGTPILNFWKEGTTLFAPTPDFSFNLNNSMLLAQGVGALGSEFLDVVGTGTITSTIPGLDPTPGTWTFNISTTNPANSTFSFQSSTTGRGRVPDGGTTVALLGATLLGLHGLRRKFSRR